MSDFVKAYQIARGTMDRLKIAARRAGPTAVMHAIANGKPVIVTKFLRIGGGRYGAGEEIIPDTTLINRYEVLANAGYFTTIEQGQINRKWNASKGIAEQLQVVYDKWNAATNENNEAAMRVRYFETELKKARGESESTAAKLKAAEAKGMAVFTDIKKKVDI